MINADLLTPFRLVWISQPPGEPTLHRTGAGGPELCHLPRRNFALDFAPNKLFVDQKDRDDFHTLTWSHFVS